jgi:hypothetical protein
MEADDDDDYDYNMGSDSGSEDDAPRASKKRRVAVPLVPYVPFDYSEYNKMLLPQHDLEEHFLFNKGQHDLYYSPWPETRDDAVDAEHRARRQANVKWYRELSRLNKERYAEFNKRIAALANTPFRIPKAPPLADVLEFYLLNLDLSAFGEALLHGDRTLLEMAFKNHGVKLYYAVGLGGAPYDPKLLRSLDKHCVTVLPPPLAVNGVVPVLHVPHGLLRLWQWFAVGVYERHGFSEAVKQIEIRMQVNSVQAIVASPTTPGYLTICMRFLIRAVLDRDDKDGARDAFVFCFARETVPARSILEQITEPWSTVPAFSVPNDRFYTSAQIYNSATRCFNLGPKCALLLLMGGYAGGIAERLVSAITETTRTYFDAFVDAQVQRNPQFVTEMVFKLTYTRVLTPFLADCVKGWLSHPTIMQGALHVRNALRDAVYTWSINSGRYDLFPLFPVPGDDANLRFHLRVQRWLYFGSDPTVVVTAAQMAMSLAKVSADSFAERLPFGADANLRPLYSLCFPAFLVVEGSVAEWKELLGVSMLHEDPHSRQWLLLSLLRTVPPREDHDDAARLVLAGIMACEAVGVPRFLSLLMQRVARVLNARRSPVLWEEYFYGPTGRQLIGAVFELEANERARIAHGPQTRDDVHQVGTRRDLTFHQAMPALLEKYAMAAERFSAMWNTTGLRLSDIYKPRFAALDCTRDDLAMLRTLQKFETMMGPQKDSRLLQRILDMEQLKRSSVPAAREAVNNFTRWFNTGTVRAMRHAWEQIFAYMENVL